MEETKKNSVLIVDDENSNIMALSHILSPSYTVYAAKNGLNAIEAARKHMPDVILLDIVMPDMDGYAAIGALKASDETRDTAVIFITGLSDPGDEEKGLSLGAADYISKPFIPAIVKLRVQNQIKIINQTRMIIEKETAARILHARSEFLSRMSHEMRTPLNAIMGMTLLAKNASGGDKRDDMLDEINRASGQLLKLIDDVLEMSDIEDNKLRLVCSGFRFADMMDKILGRAAPGIEQKSQTLAAHIDPSIPDTLYGDENRIAEVISNLLSNAVKFTPEHGAVQIAASALKKDEKSVTLQVEVADDGIGMTAEQRERLFIPFEQGDGGIDRKFGGAGLGLAISKYIVGLMGGKIWAETKPGKGTKLIFTAEMLLPPEAPAASAVTAAAAETASTAVTAASTQHSAATAPVPDETPPATETPDNAESRLSPLSGKTVLLADDVDINREIVLAMLEGTGLTIECAENGLEALEIFSAASHKYNAILMDVNMPVMDGVEATRRIRALGTREAERVPIIAMTANVLISEVEKFLAGGMTGHIGKPVEIDTLLGALSQHLR